MSWNMHNLSRVIGKIPDALLPKCFYNFSNSINHFFQHFNQRENQLWEENYCAESENGLSDSNKSDTLESVSINLSEDQISLNSSESYYCEDDDIGMLALTEEEKTNKRLLKIQEDDESFKKQICLIDYKKLYIMMAVSDQL